MGNCWSFCCGETDARDGEYPPEERLRLLTIQARRRRVARQVRHLRHVENIDELVERILEDMPPIYYAEPELPAEIIYIR